MPRRPSRADTRQPAVARGGLNVVSSSSGARVVDDAGAREDGARIVGVRRIPAARCDPGLSASCVRGPAGLPAGGIVTCRADAWSERDARQRRTDTWLADVGKTALGSVTLFCIVSAVHPDPAAARAVTFDIPDIPDNFVEALDVSNFTIPTSPMDFIRFLLSNPYAAVAASVAAYVVIPKAAEILVKYLLVPALILFIAFEASQHPDETIALVAAAINQAREHPNVTSGIILALLAIVLSPYILVAAAVGVIVSGVQLLPDQLKPILPGPVREVEAQIDQLQRAVSPQVKQVKAIGAQALQDQRRLQREAERKAKELKEESERRKEAASLAAEAKVKEVRDAALAPVRAMQSTVDDTVKQVEGARDAVVDAATEAAAVAAKVEAEANSMTSCTNRETPEERSRCVDELRAKRNEQKTREMREKAARLRANSVKGISAMPNVPDVGKVLENNPLTSGG